MVLSISAMSVKKQGKYRFHDFEVDFAHRSLRRGGHNIAISSRTFDLLALLILKPQRVITQDELMQALWPESQVEESNLSQHIFLLRKALTGAQSGDRLLATIPGRGYQFTAPVSEVPESGAHRDAGPKPDPDLASTDTADSNPPDDFQASLIASSSAGPSARPVVPGADSWTRLSLRPALPKDDDAEDATAERGPVGGFRRPGPWQAAILAATVAGIGFCGLLGWRWMHRPAPEYLGLVIANFENTTGDPQLDQALETAFRIDLQQSPFLKIATPEQIADNLARLSMTADGSPPASPRLTPQLAREACQRIHDQAYLTGTIRGFAKRFLVTIAAFDCSDGGKLATSRGIADSPDGLVSVLDKVGADLRRQLGESSPSVERFDKSLFVGRSANLETLKAYSEAHRLQSEGKLEESLTLLQHTVEIDPEFALAFEELGAVYLNLGQRDLAMAALTRAFQLRDSVGEPHRLDIVATYNDFVTGDIQASIHDYKDWSEEYPGNPAPLANLADRLTQIGKPALALDPAQRALKFNSADPHTYAVLARAQLSVGQFDEAARTCQAAISRHVDGEQVHGSLLQIAFLRLDQPAIDEQVAWGRAQSGNQGNAAELYMLWQQGLIDFASGKVKSAEAIFSHVADGYRKLGQNERASRVLGSLPRMEAELGLTNAAEARLTRMPEPGEAGIGGTGMGRMGTGGLADIPVAWADVGETSRAQAWLKLELDAHPTDTLWQEDYVPQIKGAIALNQKRPEDAVDDLKPALPFDLRSFDAPALRGRAYLAAKQPELAETEFHKILDHPGIEPLSHDYPLAQLGLARALAGQGKTVEAGFAYKVVLQIWKDADPDLPRLKEAKAEYLRLSGAPVESRLAAPGASAAKPSASQR